MRTNLLLAAGALLTLIVPPLAAQQTRQGPTAPWDTAKVIHYHIVASYKARTIIAYQEDGGQADVTDRVTVDFDWNVRDGKIVGTAQFVNAKSELKNLQNVEKSCPPPVPKGDFEYIDVSQVRSNGDPSIELLGTTSYPNIDVTAMCQGSSYKLSVAAKQEPIVIMIPILEASMLALPIPAGIPLSQENPFGVSADKKSLLAVSGDWTFTYTPTIVS